METRNEENTTQSTSTNELEKNSAISTHLENHIRYFGGGDEITVDSIARKNRELGENPVKAYANAVLVSGGAGLGIKGCPFKMFKPKEAIGVLHHSHHTGIFKNDGWIDEALWNKLSRNCSQAKPNDESVIIVTEKTFYEFLKDCRALENSRDLSGKLASNAEWENYWNKFGEKGPDGRYVKVADLRIFFEDSAKVGEEVERRVNGM